MESLSRASPAPGLLSNRQLPHPRIVSARRFESSRDGKVSIIVDTLSALREERTQNLTMSLNIPHREKLNGSAAATKAVILVTRSPMGQQDFS
jgi:hypothetical protein